MAADEVIVALFAHSKFCHDNNNTTTQRSSTQLKKCALSLHQVNINNKFILSVHFDHFRMFWACGGGCRREWRFFSLLAALWLGNSFLLMPCMLPKEIRMYWCDYIGINS
jgi:hypothetical protein